MLSSTLSNPPLESNDIKDPKSLSTLGGGGFRSIELNEPILKMNYLRILFLAFESFFEMGLLKCVPVDIPIRCI